MLAPSIMAHALNGLLMLAAVIVAYINISVLRRLEPFKIVMILLVFSIAIGIHGLSHLGLESVYGLDFSDVYGYFSPSF
jgi:tetrahydromethanopterin S-methyltransferase subunit E